MSELSIRPARQTGMGGLINYGAIVPAIGLLLMGGALGLAIRSRGGPIWPLIVALAPFGLSVLL